MIWLSKVSIKGRVWEGGLLKEIKNFAKKSGLKTIVLTTRSYQAKDFYLKQDFQVYGSLDDLPFKGVKTYYMAYRVD